MPLPTVSRQLHARVSELQSWSFQRIFCQWIVVELLWRLKLKECKSCDHASVEMFTSINITCSMKGIMQFHCSFFIAIAIKWPFRKELCCCWWQTDVTAGGNTRDCRVRRSHFVTNGPPEPAGKELNAQFIFCGVPIKIQSVQGGRRSTLLFTLTSLQKQRQCANSFSLKTCFQLRWSLHGNRGKMSPVHSVPRRSQLEAVVWHKSQYEV